MSCIKLTRKLGFSPEIQLDYIRIFPFTKPKKGDAHMGKKVFMDDNWLMLWLVGENDFYFTASADNPISKYDLNQPFIMLSHLFYWVNDVNFGMEIGTSSHFLVNQLLFGIKNYLRNQSENVYIYGMVDDVVIRLFREYDMNIKINPLEVSKLKASIAVARFNQIQLKQKCKNDLKNFSIDFKNVCDKITSALGVVKCEQKSDVKKVSKETQIANTTSEKGTQIESKQIERGTQIGIICEDASVQVDVYTNQMQQLKKNCVELKKQLDRYKKEDEDTIVMSTLEYTKLMRDCTQDIENARQEGYKKYSNNFNKYLEENPLKREDMLKLMFRHDNVEMGELVQVWMMQWVLKAYYLSMSVYMKDKGEVLDFIGFWKDIVLVNIGKFTHPIFKLLLKEWVDLVRNLQKSEIKNPEEMINICFNHFATNYIGDMYYERTLIPVFFNLLFSECRNIPILMGMINFYQYKKKIVKKEKNNFLLDFQLLFVVEKPLSILKKNKDVITIDEGASRILLQLT